jgi:putative transposase
LSLNKRRSLAENEHEELSLRRQCELLSLNRSSFYYEAHSEPKDLELMHLIDKLFTDCPFFGYRRITAVLKRAGHVVNSKRVRRLMRGMGFEAIYPKKKTTVSLKEHRKYPYLLRDVEVRRPNHVWATDITYVRMRHGFLYLTVVMDWFSRYVLSWKLSNSLDLGFCLEALEEALGRHKRPDIFNSDQGCQYTSEIFTNRLHKAGISISMAGRGRCYDNIFVERLWRSVKYEEVYLKDYQTGYDAKASLSRYFALYNEQRPHQSLGDRTPKEVYFMQGV